MYLCARTVPLALYTDNDEYKYMEFKTCYVWNSVKQSLAFLKNFLSVKFYGMNFTANDKVAPNWITEIEWEALAMIALNEAKFPFYTTAVLSHSTKSIETI